MSFESQKTLLQSCEPLLVGVCEWNRLARAGVILTVDQVRADLRSRFKECGELAAEAGLSRGWASVQPALLCFADSMVENLPVTSLSKEWAKHRLADEAHGIATGESAFFSSFLLPHLAELGRLKTPELVQTTEVYYACLQLGFLGSYGNKPAELARLKSSMAIYLGNLHGRTSRDKITPDAYEHTIKKAIDVDTKPAFWGLTLLTLVFAVAFFGYVGFLYNGATKSLHQSVNTILTNTPPPVGN